MSLSKKTTDVCIVFFSLVLIGIQAADLSEQMYDGISGYEFSDELQNNFRNIANSAQCSFTCLTFNCSSFTYNKVTKECRIHSRKFCSPAGATPVPASTYYEVAVKTSRSRSRCEDINLPLGIISGVYRVYPSPGKSRPYYCYCAAGKFWNVIQYRYDGSLRFDRTWNEYKNGFGSLTKEFWLGNDEIHRLTVGGDSMLRIEMEDFSNSKKYVQYNIFYVDNEQGKYKLTIGSYSGTAGDAFNTYHNGMYFSTEDRDNDADGPHGFNCAKYYKSGYWYRGCHENNLNGKYPSWLAYHDPLTYSRVKVSRMMVRKN